MTGAGQAHSNRWVWPPPLGTAHHIEETTHEDAEAKKRTAHRFLSAGSSLCSLLRFLPLSATVLLVHQAAFGTFAYD